MAQEHECRLDSLLDMPREQAFSLFVDRPGLWWSSPFRKRGQDHEKGDVEVGIEPFAGGSCYEINGDGRRWIWGTVLSIETPLYIRLAWQISQEGEQIADPAAASRVMVNFRQAGEMTRLEIIHNEFLRHGENGTDYSKRMRQSEGWPRIVERLQKAARDVS